MEGEGGMGGREKGKRIARIKKKKGKWGNGKRDRRIGRKMGEGRRREQVGDKAKRKNRK